MEQNDYIIVEDFDREYGIEDLLPVDLATELLTSLSNEMVAAMITPQGHLHSGRLLVPSHELMQAIEKSNAENPVVSFSNKMNKWHVIAAPLVHELEVIGYLLVQYETARADVMVPVSMAGLAGLFNRLIFIGYQNKMAVGLHGQVVADNHIRLKEKAARLEISEKKYRCLAENLEVEVAQKTQDIQQAQLLMLQQEKLASIGSLAAGIAHEINNPMGYITSNLNSLQTSLASLSRLLTAHKEFIHHLKGVFPKGTPPHEIGTQIASLEDLHDKLEIDFVLTDSRAMITESLEGADIVKTIVSALKDFSHPSVESYESVDINKCLDTVLVILDKMIGPKITIEKHYGRIPKPSCKLRDINQVFYQIMINALHAVGAEGTITLNTRKSGKHVLITIGDTGPGIPASIQSRIFEPFFTTREVGQGTGLGLNLAYNIMQQHGGSLTVASESGQGATFSIRLPIAGGAPDQNSVERQVIE